MAATAASALALRRTDIRLAALRPGIEQRWAHGRIRAGAGPVRSVEGCGPAPGPRPVDAATGRGWDEAPWHPPTGHTPNRGTAGPGPRRRPSHAGGSDPRAGRRAEHHADAAPGERGHRRVPPGLHQMARTAALAP